VRNRIARLAATVAIVVLSATPAVAETAPGGERTFFLRGEGCDTTTDLYLSVSNGSDGYDGCGASFGLPLNEVNHQVYGTPADRFTTRDGVPVTLDATRDVAGELRAEAWFDEDAPGLGQIVVDIMVHGITTTNAGVQLGSTTEEAMNTGVYGVKIPFTLDIPAGLNRLTLKSLSIDVRVRGVNFNSSNLGLDAESKFTLPIVLPEA
jgi:hypothetical protein